MQVINSDCTLILYLLLFKLTSTVMLPRIRLIFFRAAGQIGVPCFIIACDAMEEDDFFVQKVSALSSSYSTDCTQEGWVYICKTKAGNRALWQHYFTQVLLPIIVTSRKVHQRGNPVSVDGSPLPFQFESPLYALFRR